MSAIRATSGRLSALRTFAVLTRSEMFAVSTRLAVWAALGLGLGNLWAGLVFGTGGWLPTFVALDIVCAYFASALWLVAIYLGARPPLAPPGIGTAAKAAASAVVIAAMLTVAGTVAVAVQLLRGDAPLDLPLYVSGIYANLGLSTVQLVALGVGLQGILGRRWFATAAIATVWIGTNLVFEHPLLRFGAPITPASGMNGFGPFVTSQIALGIHWTAFCIALLALGNWLTGRRLANAGGPPLRPLGPDAFAVVWIAIMVWTVSGGWILHKADIGNDARPEPPFADLPRPASGGNALRDVQPAYARLYLDIAINPFERFLVIRGTAIVANRRDVPIPELRFGVPDAVDLLALTTTGDFVGVDAATGLRRYRLNRPLEPQETLRIAFELRWATKAFADTDARLVENGASFSTADIVPALGHANDGPFRSAPPVAFRARIGTSLDQIAVTAGTLVRAWRENGWRFFEYESQEPIPPLVTIHSGRYAIQRVAGDEGIIEVYHHPSHRANAAHMLAIGQSALAQRSKSASDANRLVRLVEVPGYRPFRRLGLLGFSRGEAPAVAATGPVLLYSERGYLLNRPPPSESTPPRA